MNLDAVLENNTEEQLLIINSDWGLYNSCSRTKEIIQNNRSNFINEHQIIGKFDNKNLYNVVYNLAYIIDGYSGLRRGFPMEHIQIFKTKSGDYIATISPYTNSYEEKLKIIGYERCNQQIYNEECFTYKKYIYVQNVEKKKMKSIKNFSELLKPSTKKIFKYNFLSDMNIKNLIYDTNYGDYIINSQLLQNLLQNREEMVEEFKLKKKFNIFNENKKKVINKIDKYITDKYITPIKAEAYKTNDSRYIVFISICPLENKDKILKEGFIEYKKIITYDTRKLENGKLEKNSDCHRLISFYKYFD